MFTNPVLISIVLMLTLCFFRFNVFLAIVIAGVFAGVLNTYLPYFSGSADATAVMPNFFKTLAKITNDFTEGMAGNLETSFSYVLVGALAMAISQTNLTVAFVRFVSKYLTNNKVILLICIALVASTSQNIIPIHIALMPIMLPPLITLFNKLKIDRRAVAIAATFGLTTPYMAFPLGFGLIFQNIITRELNRSGLEIVRADVTSVVWLLFFIMLFGFFAGIFYYRKPKEYKIIEEKYQDIDNVKFGKSEILVGIALFITLVLQLTTESLALSSLIGFLFIFVTGALPFSKLSDIFNQGFSLMGYVAFIMLVACGFGTILRSTGGIDEMVNLALSLTDSKFLVALVMMIAGLVITLGIGSSFGTVPIVATLFTPICLAFGFSQASIIFIIACAGAVGDTGSPASEQTLGVNAGLNTDGQCDHIGDVCIPTFIFYNIPLVVLGAVVAYYL